VNIYKHGDNEKFPDHIRHTWRIKKKQNDNNKAEIYIQLLMYVTGIYSLVLRLKLLNIILINSN
jgi:hypothetical protein